MDDGQRAVTPDTVLRSAQVSRRNVLLGGLAALGGVAAAGALTGCAPTASASASGRQSLEFWSLLGGGDGIRMTALIDEAVANSTTFDVGQTVLAWGPPYYTKLSMASVGGRGPDVAIMHATRLPGYAPGGLLDPWDEDLLAEVGLSKDNFLDPVWEKGTVDGKIYSIALDTHPFIMMYNTDVADKAGVLGSNGQLEEITSPDQFLEVARAMQAVTGVHGLSYGYLGDGAQMWRLFYTLFKQQGGEMDLSGSEAVVDTDAAVTALEYMQQLLDGTIATASGDYATALSEFTSGTSGMFFTGVWELPTAINAGIPFNAQPIPTLFGTPAAYADSHAYVLPHQLSLDEEKRRASYEFVAAILKDSVDWAEAGHIPAYQPVVQSSEYQALEPQKNYASAAEIVNYDPPAWFTGSGSDFQNYFRDAVQGVLLSGDDAAAGFDAFIKRLNQLMAKPNPV